MPPLETESQTDWVEHAWSDKEGDLRLRDAIKEEHRPHAIAAFGSLVLAALGLNIAYQIVLAGGMIIGGLVLAGVIVLGCIGLSALQELDCRLREDQECRLCRKETARWEAGS